VVSTVLVSEAGLGGFHMAFSVIGALAGTGLLVAAAGLSRRGQGRDTCPAPTEEAVAA
jgi:hypothetical protein